MFNGIYSECSSWAVCKWWNYIRWKPLLMWNFDFFFHPHIRVFIGFVDKLSWSFFGNAISRVHLFVSVVICVFVLALSPVSTLLENISARTVCILIFPFFFFFILLNVMNRMGKIRQQHRFNDVWSSRVPENEEYVFLYPCLCVSLTFSIDKRKLYNYTISLSSSCK